MRNSRAGHEAVEHTADLAVRAWAPDLAGLIEEIARGMLGLMREEQPPASDYVEVTGEGNDAEDILVDCLREILALWTVNRQLPVSVVTCETFPHHAACIVGLAGSAEGDVFPEQEIKAVTYHDLRVQRSAGRLEVTVVFDV